MGAWKPEQRDGIAPWVSKLDGRADTVYRAVEQSAKLQAAVAAEMIFWKNASEARLKYYERHLKPYLVAVRKAEAGPALTLLQQHEIRIACAEKHLPLLPLGATEFAEMINVAREATLSLIHPSLEEWLPDIRENYRILIPGLI